MYMQSLNTLCHFFLPFIEELIILSYQFEIIIKVSLKN